MPHRGDRRAVSAEAEQTGCANFASESVAWGIPGLVPELGAAVCGQRRPASGVRSITLAK